MKLFCKLFSGRSQRRSWRIISVPKSNADCIVDVETRYYFKLITYSKYLHYLNQETYGIIGLTMFTGVRERY